MNKLGQRLWWMNRDDPRFHSSPWAKLGYSIVWLIGLGVLLLFAEFILKMLELFKSA